MTTRKILLAAVTTLVSVGIAGFSAPAAHADSSWGCNGCLVAHHGHSK